MSAGGGGAAAPLGVTLLMTLLAAVVALRCPRCHSGGCEDVTCPSPHDVCRRTTVSALRGGRLLVREEGGCDVSGVPDVTVTFRSHGEVVTLREERCRGGEGCPSPTLPAAPSPPPGSAPPLRCLTCDAADGSCGRPLTALRCPRVTDYCLDVITRPPGEVGEGRVRGCGGAGACRGLVGLETGRGRRVALRCCARDRCDPEAEPPPSGLRCWGCDGPDPRGCAPQVLLCGGGLTHCATARTYGPSGEPWVVRGCASAAWCETPVGLTGLRGGALPHCCRGALCNGPPGAPPSAAAPRPHGAPLPPLPLLLLLLAAPHI